MKLNVITKIGALIVAAALSACSKQSAPIPPQQAAATQAPSTQPQTPPTNRAPITIVAVYLLGNSLATTDWYRITELQNTGTVAVTAFQGYWTIRDDLDAVVAEQKVRFTSDTPYITSKGNEAPHVIAPGDKLVIINKNDSSVISDFASTKENLTNCIYGYAQFMELGQLENWRVTKKINFELEKCVTQ